MKDNEIFDYIKKETENIPVPDSLAPKQIEKNLSGKKQRKYILYRKRSSVLVAAACLCLVIIAGFAAYPHLYSSFDSPIIKTAENKESDTASVTYHEVYEHINDYWDSLSDSDLTDGASAGASLEENAVTSDAEDAKSATAEQESPNAASDDYSETDLQVKGIMEGDIVKTDGKYIYTMMESTMGYEVTIYLADGAATKQVSKISVQDSDCKEMYLHEGKLILTGNSWRNAREKTDAYPEQYEYDVEYVKPYANETEIIVYDISQPEKPKKLSSLTQSGTYNTSRISNGYLYTFTNYAVWERNIKENEPEDYIPQINDKVIEEENIQFLDDAGTNSYLVMTSLKLDSPKDFSDSLTTLGGGSDFYVNDSHIYVTQITYKDYWLVGGQNYTAIVKYKYKDGKFSYHARTQVRGEIKNSYYMHEYKGNFCFVYTKYKRRSTSNGLCVLDDKLNLLGEISNLGRDERIYSSYYIDNMAYFVTFRETDPVFAVDLSNPKKPTLKSELKLPGFSSYLHSFGDGKLLGIGEHFSKKRAGGVKFSMFSIDKDYKITEQAKKLLSENTMCYADENHKAVFVDEERSLFGVGIEDDYEPVNSEYAVYSFANNKFKKVLSCKLAGSVENVRGIRIGTTFYVVDVEDEITAYDMNTWKKL